MKTWPRILTGPAVGLCARFLMFAPACLVFWLLLLPWYAGLVAHAAQLLLSAFFAAPLVDASVVSAGFLNSATEIAFHNPEGRQLVMKNVGHLVANVAPFLALMLATPGISIPKRVATIGQGVVILFIAHMLTLMLRYGFGRSSLTTAIGFVSITLPFLLWIVLAWRNMPFSLSEKKILT